MSGLRYCRLGAGAATRHASANWSMSASRTKLPSRFRFRWRGARSHRMVAAARADQEPFAQDKTQPTMVSVVCQFLPQVGHHA